MMDPIVSENDEERFCLMIWERDLDWMLWDWERLAKEVASHLDLHHDLHLDLHPDPREQIHKQIESWQTDRVIWVKMAGPELLFPFVTRKADLHFCSSLVLNGSSVLQKTCDPISTRSQKRLHFSTKTQASDSSWTSTITFSCAWWQSTGSFLQIWTHVALRSTRISRNESIGSVYFCTCSCWTTSDGGLFAWKDVESWIRSTLCTYIQIHAPGWILCFSVILKNTYSQNTHARQVLYPWRALSTRSKEIMDLGHDVLERQSRFWLWRRIQILLVIHASPSTATSKTRSRQRSMHGDFAQVGWHGRWIERSHAWSDSGGCLRVSQIGTLRCRSSLFWISIPLEIPISSISLLSLCFIFVFWESIFAERRVEGIKRLVWCRMILPQISWVRLHDIPIPCKCALC